MEAVFLQFFNMSVTASWVIAVVLLLRLALRPAPKKFVCLLWLVVLFRLLCPISLEAGFSLIPQHQTIQPDIVYHTPDSVTQANPVNAVQTASPVWENALAPAPYDSVNPLQIYLWMVSWLWLFGIGVLCACTFYSWHRLRKQLREAVPEQKGIYRCDQITTPFVFGIIKPKIYLPYGFNQEQCNYVLLHEKSHLARWDFLWKPLFWLAVMLHWMNPLVWTAWYFYSRDLELACDERVIDQLNSTEKQCYSNTLLQLAVQQRGWNCPAAFGNNSIKQRIQHILQYKQKAVWTAAVALAITAMMAAALGVNPVKVYALGDLRQPLTEACLDAAAVQIQWGSVDVTLEDAEQIAQLGRQLAALQVQKKGIVWHNAATAVDDNSITFFDADQNLLERISLSGDCSKIAADATAQENCAYLNVLEPQILMDTFVQSGSAARQQLRNTTFFADLNKDGVEEQIVVNPAHWQEQTIARLAVYEENGIVDFATTLAGAHAGWDTYYLYQKGGNAYILQYNPAMSQGYANYYWKLFQFDERARPVVVKEKQLQFTVNPEQYQFDGPAIYDFLQELNTMLQDAVLLVSTENGTLQYSTVEQQLCPLAESYINWLDDGTPSASLLEKLQQKQKQLEFDGPMLALQQWLQAQQDVDWLRQELLNPKLVTIDGSQCVSFELHGINGAFLDQYAISTQNPDDGMAMLQGRRYYQYNQADQRWVLLQDDSKQYDFTQIADRWAQTFADRDGLGRYHLMDTELQKQIDGTTMEDDVALWMPIWVTGEDGGRGMFLRGSSPWVDSYQVELHQPNGTEKADFANNTSALITYDMTDSSQEHYIYQEVLTFVQEENIWKVASCTITVDEISKDIYQQAQEILVGLKNGHDTWRLDPEQVALNFIHDYLELSDGVLSKWNQKENSFVYTAADGTAYTIYLYQPALQPYDAAADFWAVKEYGYMDGKNGVRQYNIQFDSWASLHIK